MREHRVSPRLFLQRRNADAAYCSVSDTEVCLCQTPDLLQGVLSCMRTACPGDDATFQKGCGAQPRTRCASRGY